ncbi:uncharacterized protein LOC118189466, partial [Stegodyphus dumicola]|uniref:uncharacterized protein LOC118189466 n=1 Tax=Stegodyphus dumicola TaxID=202533 RepID=UPI0015B2A5AD
VDVWDDPRSLTTFRTFHQSNGNNNGTFAETSFHARSRSKEINDGSQNNVNGDAIGLQTNGTIQQNGKAPFKLDARFPDGSARNNLGTSFMKLKTSPKFGKLVNPTVTPPLSFEQKIKNNKSGGGDEEIKSLSGSTPRSKQVLTSFGSVLSNGALQNSGERCFEKNHSNSVSDDGSPLGKNKNNLPTGKELEKNGGTTDEDCVEIFLGPSDKRFGFSVVGGCDEGFGPRIENITP